LLESKLDIGTTFSFTLKLGRVISNDEILSQRAVIFPLNLTAEHQAIINLYKNIGFQILHPNSISSDNLESLKNNFRAIIVYDYDSINLCSDVIIDFLEQSESPKIAISENKAMCLEDNVFLTSITSNSTDKILLNAANICIEFLAHRSFGRAELSQRKHSINILVAEDDPTLHEINKILFSMSGHCVYYAKDGLEALDALASKRFDIAILDLHMPAISGLEVAKKYQSIRLVDRVPLVLLTADYFDSQENNEYASIFEATLIKPVSPMDLLNVIYKILNIEREVKISNNQDFVKVGLNVSQNSPEGNSDYVVNFDIFRRNIAIAGVDEISNILDIYDQEIKTQLNKLSEVISSNNYVEIYNVLHKLKGTSMSIGAIAFGNKVSQFIDSLCDNYEIDGKEVFLNKILIKVHIKTLSLLKNYILSIHSLEQA
jgi:CheY-like chemotaxis protein